MLLDPSPRTVLCAPFGARASRGPGSYRRRSVGPHDGTEDGELPVLGQGERDQLGGKVGAAHRDHDVLTASRHVGHQRALGVRGQLDAGEQGASRLVEYLQRGVLEGPRPDPRPRPIEGRP